MSSPSYLRVIRIKCAPNWVSTGPWTTPTSFSKQISSNSLTIIPGLKVPKFPPRFALGHSLTCKIEVDIWGQIAVRCFRQFSKYEIDFFSGMCFVEKCNVNGECSQTFDASSENAPDKSSTPTNSALMRFNFSTAPAPLIKICLADASFFMFEKKRIASSKKFIFIVPLLNRDSGLCILALVTSLCDTINPSVDTRATTISAANRKIWRIDMNA